MKVKMLAGTGRSHIEEVRFDNQSTSKLQLPVNADDGREQSLQATQFLTVSLENPG